MVHLDAPGSPPETGMIAADSSVAGNPAVAPGSLVVAVDKLPVVAGSFAVALNYVVVVGRFDRRHHAH